MQVVPPQTLLALNQRTSRTGWVSLGIYPFTIAGGAKVEVPNRADADVIADAVKVTQVVPGGATQWSGSVAAAGTYRVMARWPVDSGLVDADLDRAVDDAAMASFENAGQICSSVSRYLLASSIREEFLDRLWAKAAAISIGPGIYTRDFGRAMAIMRRLESGSARINGWWMGGVRAPTGGMKVSGIGRERGLTDIRNYLQVKNVAIRI
jgi:Aldehyde dehydrogenase family